MVASALAARSIHAVGRSSIARVSSNSDVWRGNFNVASTSKTLLHRKILIEKSWFLVNFIQQCFAKKEVLVKCGKIKVCKKNFDVDIDVFNFKRRVSTPYCPCPSQQEQPPKKTTGAIQRSSCKHISVLVSGLITAADVG